MPLENIEIKNITIRRGNIEEIIKVDLSIARLNSNGTVKCMVFVDPVVSRLRRQLQGGTEETVNVQYDIISPTEDILVTDFATTMGSDASINALATSVGGSGVIATGGTGSGTSSSSPSNTGVNSGTQSGINTVAIAIGATCGVAAFIAIGALIIQTQRRKRSSGRILNHPSRTSVLFITQENPISVSVTDTPVQNSQRVMFKPHGARV
jgi:hypothetical protein